MSQIDIQCYPAKNGDALLITFDDYSVLIDSGYIDTYKRYLKPAIKKLAENGKSLTLFVNTHIDADHISGALRFLTENIEAPIIEIKNVWHNAYHHVAPFEKAATKNLFSGKPLDLLPTKSIAKSGEDESKNISAEQGSSLAVLIQKGGYAWNEQFDGAAISTTNRTFVSISENINFTILSPNGEKLEALHKHWRRELYRLGYSMDDGKTFDDAFEFIIGTEKEAKIVAAKNISHKQLDLRALATTDAPEDSRVANGSSIAFCLEYKNKKMLLLGDAHPSLISQSLTSSFTAPFPIKFDLIKISHHGSIQNTSIDLLELIDSESYIISTNGDIYEHPDIQTLARIVTRKAEYKRKIYFNYRTKAAEQLDNAELKTQFNFEVIIANRDEVLNVTI